MTDEKINDEQLDKTLRVMVLDKLKEIKKAATRVAILGKYLIMRSDAWNDVKDLMQKNGYPGGRITRVHIIDLNTHLTFKVKPEGKLMHTDFLEEFKNKTPDFQVSIAHFKDLFYIRVGQKPGYHKGIRVLFPYNAIYAWAHDDVRVHGSTNAPNEVRGAAGLFMSFVARVPIKDLALICDMTGPELKELGLEDVAKELGL